MKNYISLIGRIGSDIETIEHEGNSFVNVPLAVDDSYVKESGEKVDRTYWFYLFAQGSIAKQLAKNFKKGDQLAVNGKLRTRRFMNKAKNIEEYTTEIVVQNIEYAACNTRRNESLNK